MEEKNKKTYAHMNDGESRFGDEYNTLDECIEVVKRDWENQDEDTFAWDDETDTLCPTVSIYEVSRPDMDKVHAILRKEINNRLSETEELVDSNGEYIRNAVDLAIEYAFDSAEDILLEGFYVGLEDPEEFEIEPNMECWNNLVEMVLNDGDVQTAIDKLTNSISLSIPAIGFQIYYYNAETQELRPYHDEL